MNGQNAMATAKRSGVLLPELDVAGLHGVGATVVIKGMFEIGGQNETEQTPGDSYQTLKRKKGMFNHCT